MSAQQWISAWFGVLADATANLSLLVEIIGVLIAFVSLVVTILGFTQSRPSSNQSGMRATHPWLRGIVLTVGIIGLIAFIAGHLNAGADAVNASPVQHYQAIAPGPECDGGTGAWRNGDAHTYSLACEAGGSRVTFKPNGENKDGEIFWDGSSSVATRFPMNYTVQVQVAFSSPDLFPIVGFAVGRSNPSNSVINSIDTLMTSNGNWDIYRCRPDCGSPLYHGTVPNSGLQHILRLIVHGATYTYLVDGTQMPSVTDSTVPVTSEIALWFWAHDQTTILLSNFEFTPQ